MLGNFCLSIDVVLSAQPFHYYYIVSMSMSMAITKEGKSIEIHLLMPPMVMEIALVILVCMTRQVTRRNDWLMM